MDKFIIYTDGGARGNPGPAGAGAVIYDKNGNEVKKLYKYLGEKTNNWAEYEAVFLALDGLRKIVGEKRSKECKVEVRMDSELAVRQLSGKYQIKTESLFPQFIKVWNMRVKYFPNVSFLHISREKNKEADRLANEAMDKA